MDREKVIKGLEHCFHGQECCGDIECPYYIEHLSDCCCLEECQENLKADAIALLKEQEADMIALKNAYKELAEKGSLIVRCKDCKYGNLWSDENVIVCDKLSKTRDKNWFCADGGKENGRCLTGRRLNLGSKRVGLNIFHTNVAIVLICQIVMTGNA